MADNDQKTQEPTAKRLDDARQRGDVPAAPEMRHAAMFGAGLLVVGTLGLHFAQMLLQACAGIWEDAGTLRLTPTSAPRMATALSSQSVYAIAPIFIATIGMAILGALTQGLPTVSWHRLRLKWDRLSPLAGFKRLFGKQAWIEFTKTLAKFALVAGVLGTIAWPQMTSLDRLVDADAQSISQSAAAIASRMMRVAAILVGALALADLVYQRRAYSARLRMTLQEVRDEHKQNEGDPKIKARIRAIAMQRAQQRMMAAVPNASVIVTNPTHYAVALKYDHGAMRAPVVVAKGADLLAAKIREIATAAAVPIVESPPLARALYASVQIDRPINVEHYAAVAEVISYVMRLTRNLPARSTD